MRCVRSIFDPFLPVCTRFCIGKKPKTANLGRSLPRIAYVLYVWPLSSTILIEKQSIEFYFADINNRRNLLQFITLSTKLTLNSLCQFYTLFLFSIDCVLCSNLHVNSK